MKNTLMIILSFVIFSGVNAQVSYSESEIKQKCDSILSEAEILYQYERAAWVASDLAIEKSEIKTQFGGLLIYKKNDTISAIVLSKLDKKCIYELMFKTEFNKPCKEYLHTRELTKNEANLQNIKIKMINEAIKNQVYQVNCPQGYNINMELIPYELGYKLYLILGTNQSKIVPFGNDYIFFGDKDGKITSWRKMHSRLIYSPTEYNGEKVRGLIHSHLKQELFITATDICTFKLYASLYGINEFNVLSTGLNREFKYKLKENIIETHNLQSNKLRENKATIATRYVHWQL